MDYIEKIFNKHFTRWATNLEHDVIIKHHKMMDLKDFRAAVKDIEADHLKRVCETE